MKIMIINIVLILRCITNTWPLSCDAKLWVPGGPHGLLFSVYIYIYTYTYVYIHTYIHIHIHIHIHVYVYVYVYMYMYMYICMYIYIYTHQYKLVEDFMRSHSLDPRVEKIQNNRHTYIILT